MFLLSCFWRILKSRVFKGTLLCLVVAGTILWLIYGLSFCASRQNEGERTVAKLTSALRRENPDAAAELDRMRHDHDVNALAAVIQERSRQDGESGLLDLARRLHATNTSFDLRLAELAINPKLVDSSNRADFFRAHLVALKQQESFGTQVADPRLCAELDKSQGTYLDALANASKDPVLWEQVRENPMMVFLLQHVQDRSLLDFYHEEKDWLDDILFVCVTGYCVEEDQVSPATAFDEYISGLLETARANHPYFRDSLGIVTRGGNASPEEVAGEIHAIFALFGNYGELIRACVAENRIPLGECLPVLFANQDYLAARQDEKATATAARLVKIRATMPSVWKLASDHLCLLDLASDLPNDAQALAEQYGTDDIPLFLYSKYPECLNQASQAVLRYGDLGIYILKHYESSPIFREQLVKSSLGVRIIPYTARFNEAGLERVADNEAWLDKYFEADGRPKNGQWWTTIPGGSAVGVACNWAKGSPCEWSELGWAAVDVADCALLVGTLGASAPATAARSSATTGAKAGARELAKRVTVTIGRSGEKAAASAMTRAGARAAAKKAVAGESRSILRAAVRESGRRGLQTRLVRTVRAGRVCYSVAATSANRGFLRVWESVRGAKAAWQGLSPVTRRVVYRSLLTAGLTITVVFHTVPGMMDKLPEIGAALGTFASEAMQKTCTAAAEATASFLNGLLKNAVSPQYMPLVTYLIGLLGLLAIVYVVARAFFFRKERRAFVS